MAVMKNLFQALIILLGITLAVSSPTSEARSISAEIQYDLYRAKSTASQTAILATRKTGCTLKNVIVRKEWSTLSLKERTAYNNAVLCLKSKAPISPKAVVPGARSRFDDFEVTHINQTLWIHWSSYFLPWHRYFTHAYETALRNECGYSGAQPYWDWSAHGADPSKNALFSGSGSIGGNGQAIVHNDSILTIPTDPPTPVVIAAGTGGGCVLDGPFAHSNDNLGPFGPPQVNTAFNYNPRCITRDWRPVFMAQTLQYNNITDLLNQSNLTAFQNLMVISTGVHAGGHRGLGGLQDDLYTIWQGLDLKTRPTQVTGTLTCKNSPPSANGTLDLPMNLGYNGGTYKWRDLISTIDGPFCYIYE